MAKTSKGDQTRARIIRAARELFAAAAYDRVSVRKIAAAAGVDAALINHYFGGKEKLFYAVVTYTINMDEVTTMLTTTPREQLGESIIRYAEILRRANPTSPPSGTPSPATPPPPGPSSPTLSCRSQSTSWTQTTPTGKPASPSSLAKSPVWPPPDTSSAWNPWPASTPKPSSKQ